MRLQSELHIDIGEAEIAVEQQRAAPGLRQGMRQRNREPGFADAAFPGSDRDDVARRSRRDRRRRKVDIDTRHGEPLGKSSRASKAGVNAASPSAISAAMPAS